MDYKNILIVIAAIVVLYMVYMLVYGATGSSTLTQIKDAEIEQVIEGSKLKPGNTNDYTYSAWFYVSDWDPALGTEKVLLERSLGDETSFAPKISLGDYTNSATVSVAYTEAGSDMTTVENFDCTVEGIPLQKWVNIIMVVNNRALDIYIDGKLVKTCIIPGIPKLAQESNSLVVTPAGRAFKGFTSRVRYLDHAISPSKAYQIYKEGYKSVLGNVFSKYSVKLGFYENSKEIQSISF